MAHSSPDHLITNRRARYDYDLRDEYSVGIVLTGRETKAARTGQVSLKGSFVTVKGGELWLTNASFSVIHTAPGQNQRSVDTTARKILAKKNEIAALLRAKDDGLTIVPLSMTTRTRYIKLRIATAKGKKQYDKRETIKRRDQVREAQRAIRRAF